MPGPPNSAGPVRGRGTRPLLCDGKMGQVLVKVSDQEVLGKEIEKLVKPAGVDPKDALAFVDTVFRCCPWVYVNGLDLKRWAVVGSQMASFDRDNPGVIPPLHHLIYTVLKTQIHGPQVPPPNGC